MSRSALFGIVLALLCWSQATASDWGPWETPAQAASPVGQPTPELSLLKGGVRFFQKYISPVDGPRCPMSPTCSAYALQALDKHGPFVGTLLTVDRLFHETDEREHRHPVKFADRVRFYDPLGNNDFWLAGK